MSVPNIQGGLVGQRRALTKLATIAPSYKRRAMFYVTSLFSGSYAGWDEIRVAIEARLGPNPVPNSWGGIVRSLVENGVMTETGRTKKSIIPCCHGRDVKIYKVF